MTSCSCRFAFQPPIKDNIVHRFCVDSETLGINTEALREHTIRGALTGKYPYAPLVVDVPRLLHLDSPFVDFVEDGCCKLKPPSCYVPVSGLWSISLVHY